MQVSTIDDAIALQAFVLLTSLCSRRVAGRAGLQGHHN